MPITQGDFTRYLKENGWPKAASETLAQEYGKDLTIMVNAVLDVMFEKSAAGTVKPKPPPRSIGEVTAFVAFLLETGSTTGST